MSGDRNHSQPVRATSDVLAREPDPAEQRVQEATKAHHDEAISNKLGDTMARQNRLLTEFMSELRSWRAQTPDVQLRAEFKAMAVRFERLEQTAHANEATLNAVCEVRDELRTITALIRSALNGSGHG